MCNSNKKLAKLEVISHEKITKTHYLLTVTNGNLQKPKSGQYYLLGTNSSACILKRPISLFNFDETLNTLTFYYEARGMGTRSLSTLKAGDTIDVQGPLGEGFPDFTNQKILMVSGGIGIAPFYDFIQKNIRSSEMTLISGSRNSAGLKILETFKRHSPIEIIMVTDDGSVGSQGIVTLPLQRILNKHEFDVILCCGPTVMMQAVSKIAKQLNKTCYVSLERHMACGVGACMGCTINTTNGAKKVCVDGPVFNALEVFDV